MADYTRISDEVIEPGDPLTSVLVQLLRDNALAVGGKRLLVFPATTGLLVTDRMADVGLLAGAIGGGGDGGTGGASTGGGGGGGGGFVLKEIQPADLKSGDNIPVTVGGAGQASSFGSFCSAAAGVDGVNAGAGGAGGDGNDLAGAGPALTAQGEGGAAGTSSEGGAGGAAPLFGYGGRRSTGSGLNGSGYGGGASGGFGNGVAGGNGAGGVVFILY